MRFTVLDSAREERERELWRGAAPPVERGRLNEGKAEARRSSAVLETARLARALVGSPAEVRAFMLLLESEPSVVRRIVGSRRKRVGWFVKWRGRGCAAERGEQMRTREVGEEEGAHGAKLEIQMFEHLKIWGGGGGGWR